MKCHRTTRSAITLHEVPPHYKLPIHLRSTSATALETTQGNRLGNNRQLDYKFL